MKITDFDLYRDLIKEKSGISLTQDKAYLLESRLGPVAKKWGLESLDGLTTKIRGVPDRNLVNDIIEAMTTNETSFFRDTRPFELFKDTVMAYMKQARGPRKKVRIWCAAASSGQESYTLSILLKEMALQYPGWTFEILGTDISHDILALAREGIYSQFEVQRGMPITLLVKYFTQNGDKWRINDEVRKIIRFEHFNLMEPMSRLGTFDIIFCRNVLIYFDEKTKATVLSNMAKQLEPDGFLFLGGAETVIGITDVFKPVPEKRGLYALEKSAHVMAGKPAGAKALA